MLVIGADVGGTGARAALADDERILAQTELIGITDKALAVESLVEELLARAGLSKVDAVAVGATGFQMLGAGLRERVPPRMPSRKVVLCSDMVSSYAGALGLTAGAVIAAGTGAVALGSDMRGTWHRVDGWGYLLGDSGGGSWIGREGMQAAMRASDGRPCGSPPLLRAVVERFGSPAALVAELDQRTDRSGVMAGFVPLVADAARDGDEVALDILRRAGDHLADTALAALPPDSARVVAATGNLFRIGGRLWEVFTERLAKERVELRDALGSSLDGTLTLARAALADNIPANAPSLQCFPSERTDDPGA